MTTKTKTKRTKREPKPQAPRMDADSVVAVITDQLPELAPYLDLVGVGPWVWYSGPELSGEDNKPQREKLKEIGFKFTPRGKHGTWYYWTNVHPKKRGSRKSADRSESAEDSCETVDLSTF